jgi:hypothetical protein
VRYRVVAGASPSRVVIAADRSLLAPFVAAAQALEAEGCAAIATSCGFLALFPARAAGRRRRAGLDLEPPALPELQAALPAGRRVGVVTADAASLTAAHLVAAGAAEDTPVEGLVARLAVPCDPARQSARARYRPGRGGDRRGGAAAGHRFPELGAIVLECTNMPPYAEAVRAATGLPVHDITTLIAAQFRRLPDDHRHATPRWQFWIDRGGTFTDIVGKRPDGSLTTLKLLRRTPSSTATPAVAGIRRLLGLGREASRSPRTGSRA